MSDVVVYTAIFCGRDSFRVPPSIPFDFRIFTDDPEVVKMDDRAIYVPVLVPRDPIRSARLLKAMPHLFLPDYKTWVWHDSSFDIKPGSNLAEMISRAGQLGTLIHPERNCIYDEAKVCIAQGRDDESVIVPQMQKYLSHYHHPANDGLAATGVLVRQNTPEIRRFNTEWWQEIALHSRRDQLSFNVVARRLGLPVAYLGGLWENSCFAYIGHQR